MTDAGLTIIPGITTEPYDDGYEAVLAAQSDTEIGPVWVDAHYSPSSQNLALLSTLPSTDAYWTREEGQAMLRQLSEEARRVLGRRPLGAVWMKSVKARDTGWSRVDFKSGRIVAGAAVGITRSR